MTEREFAITVVRTLQDAGFTAYWAGGCVRDELLGLVPDDYDVATSAAPQQVQKLFRHTAAIGASFGVIDVIGPKIGNVWLQVQVATFRNDGVYVDGRRPESVIFSTPEEDAQRRDFTINGLFFDPLANKLYDFVGGQQDLHDKVLRAIGNAAARFDEDKLRLLRAVRMATRFDLTIDPETMSAIRAMAPQIAVVSAERIAEELRKLFAHTNRVRGFNLLHDCGLAAVILPQADSKALTHLPVEFGFIPVLAALHGDQSPATARTIARRLKLSNDEGDALHWILSNILQLHEPLTKSRIYPILADRRSTAMIAVARALAVSKNESTFAIDQCGQILRTVAYERLNPPPLMSGDQLVESGWKPGPKFKTVLDSIRRMQLDDELNSTSDAIKIAEKMLSK